MSLRYGALLHLYLVMAFKCLHGEVFEELEELVVILDRRYLLNPLEEHVYI